MKEEDLRPLFEKWMSDDGKHPRAIERGANGEYKLMQANSAWIEWRACMHAIVRQNLQSASDRLPPTTANTDEGKQRLLNGKLSK